MVKENWMIKYFMDATNEDQETAIKYLDADEWMLFEAIKTYRLDKTYEGEN